MCGGGGLISVSCTIPFVLSGISQPAPVGKLLVESTDDIEYVSDPRIFTADLVLGTNAFLYEHFRGNDEETLLISPGEREAKRREMKKFIEKNSKTLEENKERLINSSQSPDPPTSILYKFMKNKNRNLARNKDGFPIHRLLNPTPLPRVAIN